MSYNSFSQLIEWSNAQYSHLPWRKERTLYRTLVSEIMLQQTTVGTVLNHYEKFLGEYPTIFKLAEASEEQICISWKGLGYYRRARNLLNLAVQIVEQYNGEIPTDIDALLKLKGIGPYTANALIAIGADLRGLAVDANLERVLSRFYGINEVKGPLLQQKLSNDFKANKIVTEMDRLSPRNFNESLMDLGRILCQARKATCEACPLRPDCKAFKSGDPLSFPMAGKKIVKNDLFIKLLRVVVKENNKILFYQKGSDQWLSGQWELPTFILETNDENLKQYPAIKNEKHFSEAQIFKTGITKYTIDNHLVEMNLKDFKKLTNHCEIEYLFKTPDKSLNLSTASIKVLTKIN